MLTIFLKNYLYSLGWMSPEAINRIMPSGPPVGSSPARRSKAEVEG